jgi:hypothetical protein
VVVTSEILLLETSKGTRIFKDLLQKGFSASNTVHLTCDLICEENKATAVKLRESHVEDVDLIRLIYLVRFLDFLKVVLSALLVLLEDTIKELLNQR